MPDTTKPSSGMRLVGLTLLGVSAAMLALGIYFVPQLTKASDDASKWSSPTERHKTVNPLTGKEVEVELGTPFNETQAALASAQMRTYGSFLGAVGAAIAGLACFAAAKPKPPRRRGRHGSRAPH